MAKTTDFTNFANERPNYFAGQYLLEDDFELQHKYLSDRQRYHNQSLHISGIIEGLEVELITDTKSVLIKPGSAINSNGDLIVLKKDTTFFEFGSITDGELYIHYVEEKQQQQQDDVADSYTRWIGKPILGFATQTPENSVKLAKLTIKDTITLDANNREYSGLSLPNSNSQALTLRSGGNTNPNLAVLTGSLKIDGDLTVTGAISGEIDATNIRTGQLDTARIPNLSADKITSGTISGDLTVNGAAKLGYESNLSNFGSPLMSGFYQNDGLEIVGDVPDKSHDWTHLITARHSNLNNNNQLQIAASYQSNDRVFFRKIASAGTSNPAWNEVATRGTNEFNGSQTITGNLTVNTGGVGSWNKLVVTTTSQWGDGTNQYVTIGAGGADGIMLSNPHVTWRDNRASIRYGRIGGIQTGSYWDVGVRQDGSFSFSLDGISDHKLMIAKNGNISIQGAIQPSAGSTENNGIMFPKDPAGGGGDAAWIRYYSRNPNSTDPGLKEQTTLEIGTSNDWNDHIALISSGGVGIGTNNPVAKLEVRGGQTKLEQEAWQTPTFQNSWVNYDNGYNPAGYFKDSLGIVHLRGLVRGGTNNTTIFTLPAGYIPSNRELQAVQTNNNAIGRLDILTDGQVQVVSGNNGWFSLDGVTFRAALTS
ncbi:MAG TPA: hypothetical protein V6D15_18455 [Oculatellaceae cyanobacterium]|jgi:hypothetical protein